MTVDTRTAIDDSSSIELSGMSINAICGSDDWIHLTLSTEFSVEPIVEMDLSITDNVIQCHDDDITVIEDFDDDRSDYEEIVEIMKSRFVGKRFRTVSHVQNELGNMLYDIVRSM